MTPREQELLQTVNDLRIENALLRQKIDRLIKRVFGSNSEQLDKNQLEFSACAGQILYRMFPDHVDSV